MGEYAEITSVEEFRELHGLPQGRAVAKEHHRLFDVDREWLAASPFCLIATSDTEGNCDVSPKGDPAGFAHVLDDKTLVIPDRPGNKRGDGFMNILANPHVGLIFVIPGRIETLRVNGRARLLRDAPFFDDMIVKGNRPTLAILVEVESVYFHCGKAFLRSDMWKPETWNPDVLESHARLTKRVMDTPETVEELETYYGDVYLEKLYKA
ncbi:phosphohydrolase [Actinorhabdospora filicis]|uniref:Phosphohydrolase n=1 Tax=Actinorhabdospora filicis TaxID=1785913 RepID=A0A9W6WBR1_9ACTN|nr:pyridoxamine 5'-phosphate oxidase family protein [Actinorhabdospora filicis]GLZ80333.1 phosphohydrolase [Actinorhabdospora filicis]